MNKEKLLEMFESMSIIIVQSLEEKDQTEDRIEKELFNEAKNPRYSTLTKKDIQTVIRNILITVGVKMNLATCIKEEETNFEEWLNEERKKRIARGSGVEVSKINKLIKQFRMMSDMMKKMSDGKKIPSGIMPDEILNQLK